MMPLGTNINTNATYIIIYSPENWARWNIFISTVSQNYTFKA